MTQAHALDGTCPICGESMVIARMACDHCGTALEGRFTLSTESDDGRVHRGASGSMRGEAESRFGHLARLDGTQLEFVEAFLRCRGVIKNVEDMLGISYPTVKARLANVLEALGFGEGEELPAPERRQRREILADLAAGRITTEEAHRQLASAQRNGEDEAR